MQNNVRITNLDDNLYTTPFASKQVVCRHINNYSYSCRISELELVRNMASVRGENFLINVL